MRKRKKELEPRSGRTELEFMAQVHVRKKGGWDIRSARKLIACIKLHMVDKSYGGFRWDPKKAAKHTGKSIQGCQLFYAELKKAMEKKMTLEDYFKQGRPFRVGKQQIA